MVVVLHEIHSFELGEGPVVWARGQRLEVEPRGCGFQLFCPSIRECRGNGASANLQTT